MPTKSKISAEFTKLIIPATCLQSNYDDAWMMSSCDVIMCGAPTVTKQTRPKRKRVKADIALHGNPISELRDVTCRMGSHSVTCHPTQVNAPRLTPAIQAGTRFTYPGGMEGWVDLVDLIVPGPGVEPATFRSRVRRRTAAPPRQLLLIIAIRWHCVNYRPTLTTSDHCWEVKIDHTDTTVLLLCLSSWTVG